MQAARLIDVRRPMGKECDAVERNGEREIFGVNSREARSLAELGQDVLSTVSPPGSADLLEFGVQQLAKLPRISTHLAPVQTLLELDEMPQKLVMTHGAGFP